MAGMWAGFEAGAAIGSAVGPGGTLIGGALGLILGAVGSQAAGGWQARSNESHMEAFTGLTDKIRDKCFENNVDAQKTFDSFRE